jgi:hypothetical protein
VPPATKPQIGSERAQGHDAAADVVADTHRFPTPAGGTMIYNDFVDEIEKCAVPRSSRPRR